MSVRTFLELPEDAVSALRETPERSVVETRLAAVAEWYAVGRA